MSSTKLSSIPELLAPAGNIESFYAAIEAGANSVYCGVKKFNARLRTNNFVMETFSYLVPYAHKNNVKVYLTLNTLVKQNELIDVINILYQAEQIGFDAIIVADLGVAAISRKYFPRLKLHASTQMAIHNSAGATVAQQIGFSRVILARELTLFELEAIRRRSQIELEVFIHGALCYSISGACLASSFLGGCSANRGRCTQVCRRLFKIGNREGYFFSMRDLTAVEFIPNFIKIGINSFKIEGRMKSAQYVYTTVKAYRKLLDNPAEAAAAKELLSKDLSRSKTSFFLGGLDKENTIISDTPGVGILLGKIVSVEETKIMLDSCSYNVTAGDYVRIQPVNDNTEAVTARVKKDVCSENGIFWIEVNKKILASKGDFLYLSAFKDNFNTLTKTMSLYKCKCRRFRKSYFGAEKIVRAIYSQAALNNFNNPPNKRLLIKINTLSWLPFIKHDMCDGIVLNLGLNELDAFLDDLNAASRWHKKFYIEPALFIPEEEYSKWIELIVKCKAIGISGLFINNLGNIKLAKGSFNLLHADYVLTCLNVATSKLLTSLGIKGYTFSPEDDWMNLQKLAPIQGSIYIFGYIPLFISRVNPFSSYSDLTVEDTRKNAFFLIKSNGLNYLLPAKPVCLFGKLNKINSMGIQNFIIDLSFCRPDRHYLNNIIEYYQKRKKLPGTSLFNFKLGLK